MRALSGWLELMLAEIAQRQKQARAAAEQSERRSSGDPPVRQPPVRQPSMQQSSVQPPPAHSPAPPRSGARKTRGSTVS